MMENCRIVFEKPARLLLLQGFAVDQEKLLELWDNNICPNCAREIPSGSRVGSGRKADGGFCSLNCYAEFHSLALQERAVRMQAAASRHNSN